MMTRDLQTIVMCHCNIQGTNHLVPAHSRWWQMLRPVVILCKLPHQRVVCCFQVSCNTSLLLAKLTGLLLLVSVQARQYHVSKQCYWYSWAVYESIRRRYSAVEEKMREAYSNHGNHAGFWTPRSQTTDSSSSVVCGPAELSRSPRWRLSHQYDLASWFIYWLCLGRCTKIWTRWSGLGRVQPYLHWYLYLTFELKQTPLSSILYHQFCLHSVLAFLFC